MRWLIFLLIALVLFNALAGWLGRFGLGRLPGDFSFRWRGRRVNVPLASSVLLGLIAAGIDHLIRRAPGFTTRRPVSI